MRFLIGKIFGCGCILGSVIAVHSVMGLLAVTGAFVLLMVGILTICHIVTKEGGLW